jgi:hypothetical protein
MDCHARTAVTRSNDVLQTHAIPGWRPAVYPRQHSLKTRIIVRVEVPTSRKGEKIGDLEHPGVFRIGKVRHIDDVAQIPPPRAALVEVRHQLSDTRFSARLVHYQQALIRVASTELPYEKGIEALADIAEAIPKRLVWTRDSRDVNRSDERDEVGESGPCNHVIVGIQEVSSPLWRQTSESILARKDVLGVELQGHGYAREETLLNGVQLTRQAADLAFVDGDSREDEVVLAVPTARIP